MIIRKNEFSETVDVCEDGMKALEYFENLKVTKEEPPQVLFLDLNMPVSDGWFFLSKYSQLDETIRSQISLFICTSSIDPKDMHRAQELKDVKGFREKPLSTESINEIIG